MLPDVEMDGEHDPTFGVRGGPLAERALDAGLAVMVASRCERYDSGNS